MDFIKKLLKITCKDTSPLISEMMDHSLPLSKRLRVKLHLSMCEFCHYYQDQLSFLQNMVQNLDEIGLKPKEQPVLTQEAKQKINQAIQNHR